MIVGSYLTLCYETITIFHHENVWLPSCNQVCTIYAPTNRLTSYSQLFAIALLSSYQSMHININFFLLFAILLCLAYPLLPYSHHFNFLNKSADPELEKPVNFKTHQNNSVHLLCTFYCIQLYSYVPNIINMFTCMAEKTQHSQNGYKSNQQ